MREEFFMEKEQLKQHNDNLSKEQVIIYKAKVGKTIMDVKLQQGTVWLTQQQIGRLFGTQRLAITKHLNNIFKARELDKNSVCSILEHTPRFHRKFSRLLTVQPSLNEEGRNK